MLNDLKKKNKKEKDVKLSQRYYYLNKENAQYNDERCVCAYFLYFSVSFLIKGNNSYQPTTDSGYVPCPFQCGRS